MKKKSIVLLLTVCMTLGMVACASKEAPVSFASEAESSESKILYSNQGPKEYFEPAWEQGGGQTYNKLLFDTIIGLDEEQNPTTESGAAESFEMSEDGLSLTITLRDGMKWHDGEDVTVDDVVCTLEMGAKAESLGAGVNNVIRSALYAIDGVDAYIDGSADSISGLTTDGNKITIRFAEVYPNALYALGVCPVLPEHLLGDADLSKFHTESYWQFPIGSGPFKLDSVTMGEYAYFVPFEDYWDGIADFSVYCTSSEADSDPNLVTNAAAGKVDYAYTKSYADVQALRNVEGINIYEVPVLYTRLLQFNIMNKADGSVNWLQDERVRKAFHYAIDKKAINEQIFEGAVQPADGVDTPDGNPWKAEGLEDYSYDPEKAKSLLAEAGWDTSRTLVLAYYYTDQQTIDMMAVIQHMLAEVGIKVEPKLFEGNTDETLHKQPTSKDENGVSNVEWDIMYRGFAPSTVHEYYTVIAGRNAFPINDEIQTLVDELMSTADIDEQKTIYAELETLWSDLAWEVPLYYQPIWVICSDKVDQNVDTWGNVQYFWDWDIQNWTLE